MQRICVFTGSSPGARPAYLEAARSLGRTLAEQNLTLVYGGANIGLMKQLADAALEAGGKVIGVMPHSLYNKEMGHAGLTELRLVNGMHERKAMMADLADGFVAMPGGIGTLEELFEILTWARLGFHRKPVGLLNIEGYYDKLLDFLQHSVNEEFFHSHHQKLLLESAKVTTLLKAFKRYKGPITTPQRRHQPSL